MYAVLSPAKNLDLTARDALIPTTEPEFLDDAARLATTCRRLGPKGLAAAMDLSPRLAELNAERFADWTRDHDGPESLPAALLFNGDTYRGLQAGAWDAGDRAWAQDHVGILSGLYGLLRPFDRIRPYRLEMGTAVHTRRGETLYAYWGDRLRKAVERRLAAHEDRTLVVLASQEYFGAVARGRFRVPVLRCEFQELRDGEARTISFFAKEARGAMASWMVRHRVDRRDGLRDFGALGYRFDAARSGEDTWTFVRPS